MPDDAGRGRRPAGGGVVWPSAKARYALQAATLLAMAYPHNAVKTRELAGAASIPARFLSKILGELRRAGIVTARRGYHGGYALTRPPCDITVAELLAAVGAVDVFATARDTTHAPIPLIDRLRDDLEARACATLHSSSLESLAAPRAIPS